MGWTLVALLCVLATKLLTAVRLRGLKDRLKTLRPQNSELQSHLRAAEEELAEIKEQVKVNSELVSVLRNVVRGMEERLRHPPAVGEGQECGVEASPER